MLDILTITFPIFALVALGYGSVWLGPFRPEDMKALGLYVLNIALPALLFKAVAEREVMEVVNPGYLVAYLVGGLAVLALTFGVLWLQGTGPARRAIGAMGATCPNSAYIGFPVLMLSFPDVAGVVLALNLVVENFVLVPLSLLLLESSRPKTGKPRLIALRDLVINVARRPMVIGLLAGMAAMLLGIDVPTGLARLLDLTAASAAALALFVIGGSLAGMPIRGNRMLAFQIVLGKLVLHPACVALAALALPLIGMGLRSPEMHAALILSAAMPMFGVYTILAQDYGHEDVASLAQMGATAGAFVTLTALLALLT